MNRLLRIGLASTLALAGCHPLLAGNGVLGEQVRTVAPFDAVDISLAIEAIVTANAATQSLTISGDENLLPYVLTPVESGVLKTRLHGIGGIEAVHPLRITAQATALHAVRASEAANIDVRSAATADLEVVASGASFVKLQGSGGGSLSVTLAGASALDASTYPVAGATVQVGGASTLRLHASGDPTGTVSGASSVLISGGGTCSALAVSLDSACARR